jgi:RHS repeat-associated protein
LRNTNHIVHQKAVLLQLHRAVLLCCLQILRRFLINYQYNAVGNRLSSIYEHPPSVNETTIYGYDGENRLTGVQITQGSNVKQLTFAYDPFGRRIKKTVSPSGGGSGEETTNYVYDGQNIILEYNQAGIITTRYTHGPNIDEPLAIEITGATATTPYYYHADGLGSITALSNASGSIVQRYEYDSFGNQTITTNGNIRQPFTYTAREYDAETGMYFYRARYYDPKAGRFITRDPIGFGGGDVNLYGYVSNNPVMNTDPSGLVLPQVAGAIIGTAIGGTTSFIAAYGSGARGWNLAGQTAIGMLTGAIGGALLNPYLAVGGGTVLGATGNFGSQLIESHYTGEDINWTKVGISAAAGAVGGIYGNTLSNRGADLLQTGILAGGVTGGIDSLGQILYGRSQTAKSGCK